MATRNYPLGRSGRSTLRRRRLWNRLVSIALVCALAGVPLFSFSDTLTFTGVTNKLWNVAANWSLDRVPATGDTAIINGLLTLIDGITINPDAIHLNDGATLDLQNSPTLNVASVVFGNTGSNTQASNIDFEGATGVTQVYTLGNNVTLSGNIGSLGASAQTNSNAVTLNTAATIHFNINGSSTLGSNTNSNLNNITNTGSLLSTNDNTLNINAQTFTNNGSVGKTVGGNLNFNSNNFANNGSVSFSGSGTLFVNGNVTNDAGGTFTVDNASATVLGGGTLTNDSANAITLGSLTGRGTLAGTGTFSAGSVTITGNTLNLNGTTLNTPTLTLNNAAALGLSNSATLKAASIVFGNTGGNSSNSSIIIDNTGSSAQVYTLADTMTLSGNIGEIGNTNFVNNPTVTLNTAATINANVSNNTLFLGNGLNTVINTGTISATNNNSLFIASQNFINNGSLSTTGGGTLDINSNFVNNGSVRFDGTAARFFPSVFTIHGSIINVGSGTFNSTSTNLSGTLTNNSANVVTLGNLDGAGTLTGTGAFHADSAGVGGVFKIDGTTLTVPTILINPGTALDLKNSPTLNTSSIVFATGFSFSSSSSLDLEGSNTGTQVYTLGSNITLSGAIGNIGVSSFDNTNAVTLNTAATIQATSYQGISGVAILGYNGNKYLNTINNTGSISAPISSLDINAQTFNNNGSIRTTNGNFLTFNGANFNNNGSVSMSGGGRLVINGNVTNNATGTFTADNANTTYLAGTLTNNSANQITLGDLISQGGTLAGSGAFSATGATDSSGLTLNGATLNTPTLTVNNATALTLRNSSLNASTLTNKGNVTVSAGDVATVNSSTFQQTATTARTTVDGTLTLNSVFALQNGALQGTGTINGAVNNTGGLVKPGDSPGKLNLNGNYTQGASGTLKIELGGYNQGVDSGFFAISQTANLSGVLDVKLVNNFIPQLHDVFNILGYGTRIGAFSSVFLEDPGYTYALTYNDAGHVAQLSVTSSAAVPEPSTLLSLLGVTGLFGCSRLRIRQRRIA